MPIVPKFVLSISAQKRTEQTDMTQPLFRVLNTDVNNVQNDTRIKAGTFLVTPSDYKKATEPPTFCDKLNVYPAVRYEDKQMVLSLWTGTQGDVWLSDAEGIDLLLLRAGETFLRKLPVEVISRRTKESVIVDFKITLSIRQVNEEWFSDDRVTNEIDLLDALALTKKYHNPPQNPNA